ncbi:MAG TPA: sigma-70 family RNA polymerase sigma factor [Puia sp.]
MGLSSAGRGDDALKKAFDKYYRSLTLFTEKLLGNPLLAEDFVQEAFLYLFNKSANFSDPKIEAKLVQTIKHNIIDHWRSQGSEKEREKQWMSAMPSFDDPYDDTDLIAAALMAKLWDKVEELAPGQKGVTQAYFRDGKSIHDIVKERGIRYQTVLNTKNKSIDKLKKMLGSNDATLFLIFTLFSDHWKN